MHTNMKEKENKPIWTRRKNNLEVAIFINENGKGASYINIKCKKGYPIGGSWKNQRIMLTPNQCAWFEVQLFKAREYSYTLMDKHPKKFAPPKKKK